MLLGAIRAVSLCLVDHLAAANGKQAFAVNLHSFKRGCLSHGKELRRVDPVSRIQVPDGKIVSGRNRKALSRCVAEELDQTIHLQNAGPDQMGI